MFLERECHVSSCLAMQVFTNNTAREMELGELNGTELVGEVALNLSDYFQRIKDVLKARITPLFPNPQIPSPPMCLFPQ